MRDCPTRDGMQVAPNVPKDYASNKRHFNALWARGEKPNKDDDDDGNFLYLLSDMSFL